MKTTKIIPKKEKKLVYRYERKFLIDELQTSQVNALVKLHPAMFLKPYPPRFINNIYLDTRGMDNYHDNVMGVMDRRKFRIRWYGEVFGEISKPILEIKIKHGLMGRKEAYPLRPFRLDQGFDDRYLERVFRNSVLPGNVLETLLGQQPVLINRYYRWYNATQDDRYRLTVDTDLSYYQVRRLSNQFRYHSRDREHTIVEIKYGQDDEPGAGRVAAALPFPLSRSSKYVMGVESVYH